MIISKKFFCLDLEKFMICINGLFFFINGFFVFFLRKEGMVDFFKLEMFFVLILSEIVGLFFRNGILFFFWMMCFKIGC